MLAAHSVQNSTLQHTFSPVFTGVAVPVAAPVPVAAAADPDVAAAPPEQQAPCSRVKLLLQVSHSVLSVRHLEQPLILQIVVVLVDVPEAAPVPLHLIEGRVSRIEKVTTVSMLVSFAIKF